VSEFNCIPCSPEMEGPDFLELAKKSVLICGRTGTCKSRLAKAIAEQAYAKLGRSVFLFGADTEPWNERNYPWLNIHSTPWAEVDLKYFPHGCIFVVDEIDLKTLEKLSMFSSFHKELKRRKITVIAISQDWRDWRVIASAGFEIVMIADFDLGGRSVSFHGQYFGRKGYPKDLGDRSFDFFVRLLRFCHKVFSLNLSFTSEEVKNESN
jgi:hypothetical protein